MELFEEQFKAIITKSFTITKGTGRHQFTHERQEGKDCSNQEKALGGLKDRGELLFSTDMHSLKLLSILKDTFFLPGWSGSIG